MRDKPIAIVGPTASGKTALSILLAQRIGGEIISMDSRQVYRDLDIGTAKATFEERGNVPHHGLDLILPDARFSAGQFATLAWRLIDDIQSRGRVPILVGGTGFYLRSLTHPIFEEPELDPGLRRPLQRYLESLSDEEIQRWLDRLDPISGSKFRTWGGKQRRVRALEIPLLTGRTLPWWHEHSPAGERRLEPRVFVLDFPREDLYDRINRRTAAMFEGGLVDEVKALVARGYDGETAGMKTTGYAETLAYLNGGISLDDAMAFTRRKTRAYARRQLTWFRRQLPEGSTWLDGRFPPRELVDQIISGIETDHS